MTSWYPVGNLAYHEVQQFRQIWIVLIVAFVAALAWYTFAVQILLGEPFGTNPAPDIVVLIILAVFGIAFPLWFWIMKLEIQVTGTALRFRMYPLHPSWKEIPFPEIAGVMAVVYRPLREYGGWGIRFGRKGMAYNVSGDRGVQVTLKSGKSFLLGSLRAEELELVLRSKIHAGKR
ncbi:MAG: hypothetical protein GKC05_06880 [Methanomicrobiales archaeon]|nr:hypothetical protein [Methanomicrobiales archaeon]NYT21789.1 hypothetical protein [Methanomicrobiales archaeon]